MSRNLRSQRASTPPSCVLPAACQLTGSRHLSTPPLGSRRSDCATSLLLMCVCVCVCVCLYVGLFSGAGKVPCGVKQSWRCPRGSPHRRGSACQAAPAGPFARGVALQPSLGTHHGAAGQLGGVERRAWSHLGQNPRSEPVLNVFLASHARKLPGRVPCIALVDLSMNAKRFWPPCNDICEGVLYSGGPHTLPQPGFCKRGWQSSLGCCIRHDHLITSATRIHSCVILH